MSALETTTEIVTTTEKIITVNLSEEYAGKIVASLGRALTAIDHLPAERREWLVNTHTVDHLLALKTALANEIGDGW